MYDDFSKSNAHASAEDVVRTADQSQKGNQQHVFQSLQYLRKLCNHPALVLKDDKKAIQETLTKAGCKDSVGLSDIQHAPKLQALRYVDATSIDVKYYTNMTTVNSLSTVVLAPPPP